MSGYHIDRDPARRSVGCPMPHTRLPADGPAGHGPAAAPTGTGSRAAHPAASTKQGARLFSGRRARSASPCRMYNGSRASDCAVHSSTASTRPPRASALRPGKGRPEQRFCSIGLMQHRRREELPALHTAPACPGLQGPRQGPCQHSAVGAAQLRPEPRRHRTRRTPRLR